MIARLAAAGVATVAVLGSGLLIGNASDLPVSPDTGRVGQVEVSGVTSMPLRLAQTHAGVVHPSATVSAGDPHDTTASQASSGTSSEEDSSGRLTPTTPPSDPGSSPTDSR